MKTFPFVFSLFLLNAFFSVVAQEPPPEQPSALLRAVPEDSFLCLISRPCAPGNPVCSAGIRAFQAFNESGFAEDVVQAVLDLFTGDRRDVMDRVSRDVLEAFRRIDWSRLARSELVFAEVMKAQGVSFLFLVRDTEGFSEETYRALRRLFAGIVVLDEDLELDAERCRGADISILRAVVGPAPAAAVLRRGDVLGVSFGAELSDLRACVDRMDGLSDRPSLVDTARYRSAFRTVSYPALQSSYFDLARLLGGMKARLEGIRGKERKTSEDRAVLSLILDLLREMEIMDVLVSVRGPVEQGRVVQEEHLRLAGGAGERVLYRALFNGAPVSDFARFVPAGARAFHVGSGVDPLPLYDRLWDLLRKDLPDAAGAEETWRSFQERLGFDLREDLLAWFAGGYVQVGLGAGKEGGEARPGSVLYLRLHPARTAGAEAWLEGWFKRFQAWGDRFSLPVTFQPMSLPGVRRGAEIRQSVVPFFRPFVGLYRDGLLFCTDRATARAYVAFLEGGGPDIRSDPRFQALDLAPPAEGRLEAVWFEDRTGSVLSFRKKLGMLGVISLLLPSDRKPVRALRRILGALPRLIPVVEAMDIYAAAGGISVFDPEAGVVRGRTVWKLKTAAVKEEGRGPRKQ